MIYIVLMLVVILLIGSLNIFSFSRPPNVYYKPCSRFVRNLLINTPITHQIYYPPLLWGKNMFLQHIVYGCFFQRYKMTSLSGQKGSLKLPDGALVYFHLYETQNKFTYNYNGEEPQDVDVTLLICPGLASNSNTAHVNSLARYAKDNGMRVFVLDHLGTGLNAIVTPRVYNYGDTLELVALTKYIKGKYLNTHLFAVGLSMGANMLLRAVGLMSEKSQTEFFEAVISICQGYDINKCIGYMLSWENGRYLLAMKTGSFQKRILTRHQDVLLTDAELKKHKLNVEEIMNSTTLLDFDEAYTRKVKGFPSVRSFYEWSSCVNSMYDIKIPVLCVNSEDDELVPRYIFDIPIRLTDVNEKALFITTTHGGHLCYFENGFILPDKVAWCERLVVQYSQAVIGIKYSAVNKSGELSRIDTEHLQIVPGSRSQCKAKIGSKSSKDLSEAISELTLKVKLE